MGTLLEYETVLDSDYKWNIMGLRSPKTLQTTLHTDLNISCHNLDPYKEKAKSGQWR